MTDTFRTASAAFLDNIKKSQPFNTWKGYRSDLLGEKGFISALAPQVKPSSPISDLTEEHGVKFIQSLLDRGASTRTRQRCASTVREFFRFVAYHYNLPVSVDRLKFAIKSLHLLAGAKNVREYPGEKVRKILFFCSSLHPQPNDLEMLRDLAFIFTLAQTGLRVSEACALRIGQVDKNFRATIIGKGDKKATVTFGKDARLRLNAYLKSRAGLDASTGKPRSALPLFARHDQTSGKNLVKPINQKLAQKIVHNMAALALGDEYDPKITCHILRHYFGDTIYHDKKDPKATQDAMRHSSITTTMEIYVHPNDEETSQTIKSVFG